MIPLFWMRGWVTGMMAFVRIMLAAMLVRSSFRLN